jgi:hypothetical protein
MEVMSEADVPMMHPQMMMTAMANDNKTATNAAPMVRAGLSDMALQYYLLHLMRDMQVMF